MPHPGGASPLPARAAQGGCPATAFAPPRDGICWQIRQLYRDAEVQGRFLLPGEQAAGGVQGWGAGAGLTPRPLCPAPGARGDVQVVVGETDYRAFAILYLERARRLSVKLYGASPRGPALGALSPTGEPGRPKGHRPPLPPPSSPPSFPLAS